MNTIRNLFRGRTTQASQESARDSEDISDAIYPLHMLDDTRGCREYFLAWTFRFNDVLDADQLHNSLVRLLEIGDWRKLGGRLGFNVRNIEHSHTLQGSY